MPSSRIPATEPLTTTVPRSGVYTLAITRSRVDFPQPLGPTMPRLMPTGSSSVMSCSAHISS